jgi:hypothetical protein
MAKPKPKNGAVQIQGIGVAGYALAAEVLAALEARGILSHEEVANVMDSALAGLERTDAQTPHPAFRQGRIALDAQLAWWQRQRPISARKPGPTKRPPKRR